MSFHDVIVHFVFYHCINTGFEMKGDGGGELCSTVLNLY